MMHITYKLRESPLHGIGLFADEAIAKGQLVYSASPLLDVNLTQAVFELLNDRERAEVRWWGFFDEPSQRWHVDFDVSKFINHSLEATVTQAHDHAEAYLIATRDIQRGEEITQNYLEFESEDDLTRRGITAGGSPPS